MPTRVLDIKNIENLRVLNITKVSRCLNYTRPKVPSTYDSQHLENNKS